MLSKLISNITAKKPPGGDKILSDAGEMHSEQVFQSLLQALQGGDSSDQEKQQLISLAGNLSGEEQANDGEKSILGGSFITLDNEEKTDIRALEKPPKELREISNNYTSEGKTDSSEEGQVEEQINGLSGVDESTADEVLQVDKKEVAQDGEKSGQVGSADGKEQKELAENAIVEKAKKSASGYGNTNANQQHAADEEAGIVASQSDRGGEKGVSPNTAEAKDTQQKGKDLTEAGMSPANSDKESKIQTESDGKSIEAKKEIAGLPEGKLKNSEADTEKVTENKSAGSNKASANSESGVQEKLGTQQAAHPAKNMDSESAKVKPVNHQNSQAEMRQPGREATVIQSAKREAAEQQRKVVNSVAHQQRSADVSQKGLEMKGAQTKEEKKNSSASSRRANSIRSTESRSKMLRRLGISGFQARKQSEPVAIKNFTGISVNSSEMDFQELKVSLDEQLSEQVTTQSEKETKSNSGSNSMRLGQMTINNVALRKKILPGLTHSIQKAAESAKENTGNWQKHNFVLDDGKNIQLSVRESNGVIQVKMGSMNLDLSKLLQQNLQQIREHLRQEFGSDIDLQFENQQGEESALSGDTESSDRKRNYRNNFAGESLASENTEEMRTKTVRTFGYNKMEWTA